MDENLRPTIEITNDINSVINIQPQQIIESRQLKTNDYTLNAVKRYRLKNADKMKEYHKQYYKDNKEAIKARRLETAKRQASTNTIAKEWYNAWIKVN